MSDALASWIWNVPSIDKYWNDLLRDKSKREQIDLVNNYSNDLLKEYLLLKVRWGIGKSILVKKFNLKLNKYIYWDVRDFDTWLKWHN
jgi:hypothetical protein